jgi:uncharacterized protein YraI
MKTLAFMLLVVAALAADGPRDALATADGPDYYAVTGVAAGDVLNIRAEPSAKAEKVGEIPHDGRAIRNLGCRGGPTFAEWEKMSAAERKRAGQKRWCKIRYNGTEGWVAGWFLMEDSGPAKK